MIDLMMTWWDEKVNFNDLVTTWWDEVGHIAGGMGQVGVVGQLPWAPYRTA